MVIDNFIEERSKVFCEINFYPLLTSFSIYFLHVGKIMVVGGSDGTRSLRSTEIYDKENDSWSLGPQLGIDRANVSVVTLGNKLFAVGGFSGKKFLDSLEYFNPLSEEWCCYSPVENIFQLSNAEEPNKDDNEVTDLSKKARKSHSKAQNNNILINNCANGII